MKNNTGKRSRRIASKNKYLISSYLCQVFDTMRDGLYITDNKGETLTVNEMYENLTGLKSEDIVGKNVKDLVESGVFDLALNAKVVQTKKAATAVQMTNKGRKVVLMAHPIFDYDEDVELVVTFVRDIALISQLKEQVVAQKQLINKYKHEIQQHNESLYQPSSSVMVDLYDQVRRVARTDATILFLGETGVGKDVMAREVHEKSTRKGQPFLKVDCTSIPENLIESELFGYAPGAFSGADSRGKAGMFEMADKGTLFLDEIGELPLSMQSKLLRVLQNSEIQRVGATRARQIDVRIIAATNRDLEEEVRQGNFRSDLFYRLHVAVIRIPPLRERGEDIHAMLFYFRKQFNTKYKRNLKLSAKVEEAMLNYRWDGNIREMENLMHSLAVTTHDERVELRHLPMRMLDSSAMQCEPGQIGFDIENEQGKDFKTIMAEVEAQYLLHAIERYGSMTEAAERLKINRTTIFRKLKKVGLSGDEREN
ncbi:sigma-54 interaction domain-containing protein [Pseudodesulfovibrio piezophilus]|uniref:Putative transcriptional regulatory protein (HydG) n=1 Tax=Pseudodesulfovibrio piezophilus (strain DSM 21447 / JCM 15486 / C1TLV30) TaxID=1322246 RepID=M1WPJ3_PSEP2|nr:sigma-54-dependent Fis family transcriptional regulator [Pseudodesulfovibrio piezophilus]CCH48389.1 putative transcriptional regulatory protein (HydG) [Pseudodesulfovibrio piezophilus C1TLV30]